MKTISRIVFEKQLAVAVVVAALAVVVAVYVLGVYPLTARVVNAGQRRAAAIQSVAIAQQSFQAMLVAMEGQTGARDELQHFYGEVLPDDLVGARRITYLRLAALATSSNLVLENRSSVSETKPASKLARLQSTMLLAGEWSNIRQFIDIIENGPEFIVIEGIALNQREEEGGSLVLTLGISTYYRT